MPKMGKLLTFEQAKGDLQLEGMQGYLNRQFWQNAKMDIERVVRLYLMKHYKYQVTPEVFLDQLIEFRALQSRLPSLAKEDTQKAFAYATSGGVKSVVDAFTGQKEKWQKEAVKRGERPYLSAVINAALHNDDMVLQNLKKTWLSEEGTMLMLVSAARKTDLSLACNILVEALQMTSQIDGKEIKANIEDKTGCRLPDHYTGGEIIPMKFGRILPFALKRK